MPFEGGMPGYGKPTPFQPMPFEGGMPDYGKPFGGGMQPMVSPNMGPPNMDPLLQAMMKRTRPGMRPY